MYCESCGGPLDCHEGEWYCPPCTYFGTRDRAAADDEARRERQAPAVVTNGRPKQDCPW